VDNFSNKNIYTVTQPLGNVAQYSTDVIDLEYFIADITKFTVGGFFGALKFINGEFGIGYFYDGNQYATDLTKSTSRFIDVSIFDTAKIIIPEKSANKSNTHVLELDGSFINYVHEKTMISLLAKAAFKFGSGGFVIRAPEFNMTIDNFNVGITMITEKGKLLNGHFSSMYMSNRSRVGYYRQGTLLYQTQNNILSNRRRAYGLLLFFNMNPFTGTEIQVQIKQDLFTYDPYMVIKGTGYVADRVNSNNNFSYRLAFEINEKLTPLIKYARVYVEQDHGGYYPVMGSYFTSWGFRFGIDVLSKPLFWNIALEAGYVFSYIDLYDSQGNFGSLNNNIDQNDNISQIYFGIRWGYLK
jgi:hypothetical protein